MEENRKVHQIRSIPGELQTREADSGEMIIEGYFAVFNSNYNIGPGLSESIAPGAFANSISGDIRALINHDTTLVLGRTKVNTLQLREDSRGLFGRIIINPNDSDAVNMRARVLRGDVDQCSIGFEIRSEDTDISETGEIHWTIRDVVLFEVSCCTFPAYEETSIAARCEEGAQIRKREIDAWRARAKERLKNGIKSFNASQEVK